ncbi:hypothetical protein HPB52_014373 [Rhipicephalus sanguineus]|uniref:Uncharacterized protein n=1 Tax=Rhipicephalus sanguineus TaxID=34632 RepID=A0A9D4SYM4_RHISA|nr:hypothetical protein HPB52_014373 [Rhipicephalus sanguineus]
MAPSSGHRSATLRLSVIKSERDANSTPRSVVHDVSYTGRLHRNTVPKRPRAVRRKDENLRAAPIHAPSDDCVSDVDLWPRVDISDIHEFLVLRTSFITGEQLNSRKALEGHSYEWLGAVGEGSRRRHRDRRHPSKTF